MARTPHVTLALMSFLAGGPIGAQRPADAPAPTRVVRFTPPASLPDRVKSGDCRTASLAAGSRDDAFRCTAGSTIYDPCFATSRAGHVLCDADPRQPSSGTLLALTRQAPALPEAPDAAHSAWFFELADGSTCQPVTGARREVAGLVEMYTCRFGPSGDADAVLGDLDLTTPVWTIQKVMLNKKVEPQTIKSLMIVPVKTAWQ